jgi:D-sedoheptulose 7-phosphate isomerase
VEQATQHPTSAQDPAAGALRRMVEILERRDAPAAALAGDAELVARTCQAMASRFLRGGTLMVFGNGGSCTDAQHVAVEFMHPVIVGKRALPAVSLTADVATVTGISTQASPDEVFAHQIRILGRPADIALGVSPDGSCVNVIRGLRVARELGLLPIGLVGGDGGALATAGLADYLLIARSGDPQVVKEVQVTTYHILWELVHVFLDQPAIFEPGVRA